MLDWRSILTTIAHYLGALACIAIGLLFWRSRDVSGIYGAAAFLTMGIVWLLILLWSDDEGKYNF